MTRRSVFVALASSVVLSTGCASSDYQLSVIELPGSEGAVLDVESEQVYTGLPSTVCALDTDGTMEDIGIGEGGSEAPTEVVDVEGSFVLVIDGGDAVVVDPDGLVEPVPGGEGAIDGQWLGGEAVVLVEGCTLVLPGSGLTLEVPDGACHAELHASRDTLRLHGDGGEVFELRGEGFAKLGEASDLAWDAANDQWLWAVGSVIRAERDGAIAWSYDIGVDWIDVFPYAGDVGFRDVRGGVYALKGDGGGEARLLLQGPPQGEIVGSPEEGVLFVMDGGLRMIAF